MLPKINEILFLHVNSIDEEEARQEFKSRIAEVQVDYMTIEVPIHTKTGRLKRLFVGDEINAHFVSDSGVKSYFSTTVLGFKEEVVRLVVIKTPDPESISKEQRRSFLRVPGDLEVAVKRTEQLRFLAKTDDVGGGGISFICDNYIPIKVHDILSCWLLIPYRNGSIEHAYFKGELIRVNVMANNKYLAMLQFTEIVDAERQKVIRYCFERQLDFRKK